MKGVIWTVAVDWIENGVLILCFKNLGRKGEICPEAKSAMLLPQGKSDRFIP